MTSVVNRFLLHLALALLLSGGLLGCATTSSTPDEAPAAENSDSGEATGDAKQEDPAEEAVPELFRARRRAYELDQHIVSNDAPAPTRFSPSILTQTELSPGSEV